MSIILPFFLTSNPDLIKKDVHIKNYFRDEVKKDCQVGEYGYKTVRQISKICR